MTPHEFEAALADARHAGFTPEEWFGVGREALTRWEAGQVPIPRLRMRQARWLAIAAENHNLMAHAGLPVCAQRAALDDGFAGVTHSGQPTTEQVQTYGSTILKHIDTCDVCRNNREWESRNLQNPGPFPLPGWSGAVSQLLARVPAPLVPAAIGAVFLAATVAMPLAIYLVLMAFRTPNVSTMLRLAGQGVLVVVGAAAAGAAGGLIIPITKPIRRWSSVVGEYITGVFVVTAYVIVLGLLSPLLFDEPLVDDEFSGMVTLVMSVIIGLFGTFVYRREAKVKVKSAV